MTATIEPGLRERKRRATRRAIQLAAIDLVTERGVEGTTVEEIARRADVSARTFFNYFSSKEEAVVGDRPALPDATAVERFVTAGRDEPLMTGIVRLIASVLESDAHDSELITRRKALLQDQPQLFAMRMAAMRQLEEEFAAIVARRMAADDASLAAEPELLTRRARMAAYVSFAAVRHAWNSWAAGEPTSLLVHHLDESFDDLRALMA